MKHITRLLCSAAISGTLMSVALAAAPDPASAPAIPTAAAAAAAAHAKAGVATVPASQSVSYLQGTVVSSLNTDSYTYVEISKNDQKAWIVGPLITVKEGSQVQFEEGAVMHDFYSKQLNRTFPEVMFVQSIDMVAGK